MRAAGTSEAAKQFRRVNGHLHLAALRKALDDHDAASSVTPVCHPEEEAA
jgi:putative transposase